LVYLLAKGDIAYGVVEERDVPDRAGRPSSPCREGPATPCVTSGQRIDLAGRKAQEDCRGGLKAVIFRVEESKAPPARAAGWLYSLSISSSPPVTIAVIYLARWQIEAFFRLIRRNLKIKSSLGDSANAVEIQQSPALSAILPLKLLQALSTARWFIPHLLVVIILPPGLYRVLARFLNRERPNGPRNPGAPSGVRKAFVGQALKRLFKRRRKGGLSGPGRDGPGMLENINQRVGISPENSRMENIHEKPYHVVL
jgi:hypothetical protein